VQDFFHKIIFALIAGFSEFLPVSAPAHRMLYQILTNRQIEPLLLLSVHLGCLLAAVVCCGKRIKRLRRERRLAGKMRRRRSRQTDLVLLMDASILQAAAGPVVLGTLFYHKAVEWISSLVMLSLVLFLGGIVLIIPHYIVRSNKDGRSLRRSDGIIMGIGAMLGVLPGLSRIGCGYAAGAVRGADHSYTQENLFMLSIPALAVMICLDFYTVGALWSGMTALALLGYLLAVGLSFVAGYLTITLLRYFAAKMEFSGFAYYSWGLALFTLLIYLIVY
jgi:undecaprenyl pyrophosphate phosphatase UppP